MFEIEGEKIIDALDILSNENFVEETSIFGNSIHISVNNHFKDTGQIKNVLKNHSVFVSRIEEISPTLEDVFIHLLEKKN